MTIYSSLGGDTAVPGGGGITEAEAFLEAKKVSGYLGLLSPYYFGGVGTTTTILPYQVNEWVDVNLDVDPAGTFDYRPQDMVDADAAGFTGSGLAEQLETIVLVGNLDASVPAGTTVTFPLADSPYPSGDITFTRDTDDGSTTDWIVSFGDLSRALFFNSSTGDHFATALPVGYVLLTLDQLTSISGQPSSVDASCTFSADDPYIFSLSGMTQQAFGKMRVTALFNPEIDESQLDVRLLFTPNSGGQYGQFSIAEQAATMTQGADVEYFVEPTITFFVGDSIEEIGTVGASDAGSFQLQIRSSVEGTFTLRGLTCYYHS
jgi:hypothetical protein